MNDLAGKSISHYKIIEQVGQGGMGVVYKAEDTKLKRHVALKFLPADLTADEESVDRFINEAQLASSLDHANLCTIYEINETADGQLFICMAYYEGETLAQKIKRGSLSIEEAIDIARQIALGLERVHEEGITHRDLKPTNIIITHRGEVKIVDFGIAKLAGVSRLTKTGTTLGTLAYMSPEQVQKQTVNYRTDIWSLGVVLYEMLTGKLPFQADCEAAMIYCIVNENPEPIVEYKADISEGIQRIIGKALDKNPDTRYPQVSEFLEDLKLERSGEYELIKPPLKVKSRKPTRSITKVTSYILAAILALFLIYSILTRQSRDRILPTYKQITFRGDANSPAISPDGQFLAYTVGKTGDQKLMVQDLSNAQTLEVLSGNKSIFTPVWSPNGSELAFRGQVSESSAETYIVPRLGGKDRPISVAAFFSWSPDGAYIAHANANWKGIQIKDTENYNFIAAISAYGSYNFNYDIKWSPLSNRFLYVTTGDDGFKIWTMKIDGSEKQVVVKDGYQLLSPCWSANGKAIYYFRTIGRIKQLMKVNITTSGKAVNEPEILQDGLETGDSFTISKDNKRLFYTRQLRYSNLMHLSLDDKSSVKSKQPGQLTFGTRAHFAPNISPDGKTIAFSLANEQEANIFIMPIDGSQQQQLTFMKSYNSRPCWSPDGNEIAFASRQQNSIKVWKVSAVGGTPHAFNDSRMSEEFDLTWNPGNFILYQRSDKRNFYKLNPTTEEELPLVQNEGIGWVWNPRFSPDGRYVAMNWILQFDTEESGIWLVSLDQSSQKL